TDCSHDSEGSSVSLEDGRCLRATLVIDASGHWPRLVKREGRPADAHQVAYGVFADVDEHPWDPNQMCLMDFSTPHLSKAEQKSALPTFLYAMPFGSRRVFLEET